MKLHRIYTLGFVAVVLLNTAKSSTVRLSLKKVNPSTFQSGVDTKEKTNLKSESHSGETIPLQWKEDQYYGTIYIGKNQQELSVFFDTSYHSLWVISDECTSPFCRQHRQYVRTKSYKNYRSNVTIRYKDIEMTADSGIDTIKIGDLLVKPQPLNLLKYDSWQRDMAADCIVGLGLQDPCGILMENTFFCQLINQYLIANKVFSMHFTSGENGIEGEILFGDWDSHRISEITLDFIPLVGHIDWRIEMSMISGGRNNEWIVTCGPGCIAIVDTSTWSITGPRRKIQKINNYIGADTSSGSMATVNCDSIDSLPPITLNFYGLKYTLTGKDYVVKTRTGFFPFKWDKVICVTGFIAADDDFDPWKLGMVFLKKFYTVFNYEQKSIAFAHPIK